MRTTLSLKIPKRSVTPLIAVLLLTGTVSLGTACDDDKDYSRREHIEWSNSPEFCSSTRRRSEPTKWPRWSRPGGRSPGRMICAIFLEKVHFAGEDTKNYAAMRKSCPI